MKINGRMEAMIVFAVMTGLFLPVRFLFVTYVTDDWFGSFGVVSSLAVIVVVLAKRDKLGAFGRMFINQMMKVHTGKRRIFVYTHLAFGLIVMGLLITSINLGNSVYLEEKNYIIAVAESQGQSLDSAEDLTQLTEELGETSAEEFIDSFIQIGNLLFNRFPYFTALWAIEDDMTEGFLLHFSTVAFVEVLEFVGILIYFRITLAKTMGKAKKKETDDKTTTSTIPSVSTDRFDEKETKNG